MNKKKQIASNVTNSITHESEGVRVSIFWTQFAKVKTVCSATIRYKGYGKVKFDRIARRNREAGDEYDERIGIEFSGRRAVESLKKKSIAIDKEADILFEKYHRMVKIGRALSNAAYDIEEKLNAGLSKNILVAREGAPVPDKK